MQITAIKRKRISYEQVAKLANAAAQKVAEGGFESHRLNRPKLIVGSTPTLFAEPLCYSIMRAIYAIQGYGSRPITEDSLMHCGLFR